MNLVTRKKRVSRLIYFPVKNRMVSSRVVIARAAIHGAILSVSLHVCPTDAVIGSRPSDHYFRSVCLSVCLCRVFLSRL